MNTWWKSIVKKSMQCKTLLQFVIIIIFSILLGVPAITLSAENRGIVLNGTTERVSIGSSGEQANYSSRTLSISADGRFVAFDSGASNLVPGGTNGVDNIFVRDRQNGLTELVSVNSSGEQGNHPSVYPSISAGGRYVAFTSSASNLVVGDTNGADDIFVHDRQSGLTERVSVNTSGEQGNNTSWYPSISADGRYVAFASSATNLVPGDTNGFWDVFVHDRQSGLTERVSVSSNGEQGNDFSRYPSISADGRYIAFLSYSSNLVNGDTNGMPDVFVHDKQTGFTERVSVSSSGEQGNADSYDPSISSDGRYVAFYSYASNFVDGDTNGTWDVFVHDRQGGLTERVSVSSSGQQGNGQSCALSLWYDLLCVSISADGRYVVFESSATNLVDGDTNGHWDVFVHDRQTGITERVSVSSSGEQENESSCDWDHDYRSISCISISGDGRYVAFNSLASNLVDGDTNGAYDIFVRDREVGGEVNSISGHIEDSNHNPISGVSISAGQGYSGITDDQGNYRIDNLPPDTYTVVPSLAGYTFNPLSQVRTLPRDTAPADFTAIPIQITNIEINQGLGNQFQGEQNFVADKETAIRVILNAPVIIDPQNQQLVVRRNDGFTAYLVPRGKLNTTTKILIFLCDLPSDCGNWDSGDYIFEATVNGVTAQKSVSFQPRRTLRILAVPIKVTDRGVIKSLPDNQWKTAWSFTNDVYPMASDSIFWTEHEELDATYLDLTGLVQRLILYEQLLHLQPFACGTGFNPPCYDKIIGFIPPMPICGVDQCTGSGCLRGWTRGDVIVVMANGSYKNPLDGNNKTITSMQQAVAHEIGHGFGLGDEYDKWNGAFECQINPAPSSYFGKFSDNNSNACNPDNCPGSDPKWPFPNIATGSTIYQLIDHPFDVDGLGSLGDKLSFMGSAGESPENYWITPPAYHHLFNQFAIENLPTIYPNQVGRVMHAQGWISQDDIITIDPGYSFTDTLPAQITGTYKIEAIDSISNTLATQGFEVSFVVLSDPPQEIDPAPFNVDIAYPIGTAAFRIKHGDTVLKIVPVTVHGPVVSVIFPNGGETWGANENQTISWTGSDADGDPLTYIVLFSPDGINWMTLGAMITNTQLIVDTSQIAGGDTAMIRVIATDGVNTSMDDSNGVFSVGKKAPEAFILSPTDNAFLPFGVSSFLHGYAYDLEDGTLADSTLRWYSDKDGYLGNGKLILVDLSYGSHLITLSVTDSDGNTTSTSIRIFVGNQIFLPLTIKR